MTIKNKKILIILRHENSLEIVRSFIEGHGGLTASVALDVIELSEQVPKAMKDIRTEVPLADAIVMGTKVYDRTKDGPNQLFDFLDFLDECGVRGKPVLMTHLDNMPETMKNRLQNRTNLSWVENDNLGRDGMKNLGPLILRAFNSVPKDFRPPALG